jgi:CBS domain containing-hemolysin-like protein
LTGLHITVGEQAAKSFAIGSAARVPIRCSMPIEVVYRALRPLVLGLNAARTASSGCSAASRRRATPRRPATRATAASRCSAPTGSSAVSCCCATSPTQRLDVLLERLRAASSSIAAVVDEYGELEGLVTVEDIVEELVGDIWDEDDRPMRIRRLADGALVVKGDAALIDLERHGIALGPSTSVSVGGLVRERLGRVPVRGRPRGGRGPPAAGALDPRPPGAPGADPAGHLASRANAGMPATADRP